MVDLTVGSAASLQFAIDAQQSLALSRAQGARAPGGVLPDQLKAQRVNGGVTLSVPNARTAVEAAIIAGFGVVSALETLAGAFRLAANTGLVGPLTGLNFDGTRISGVTITAQGNRLVDAINGLVESAEVKGANLISSKSARVSIQTTEFGGKITVSPQALDADALDLNDLSGVTRQEALASLGRIKTALTAARTRLDNLEVLRDNLNPGARISNELVRVINSASTGFLPRGSLVNQVA